MTTNAVENVKNVDFWNNTQILHVKYCNDNKNKNKNKYHVSRLCNSCISRFLHIGIEACNWCIYTCLSICEMVEYMLADTKHTTLEMKTI